MSVLRRLIYLDGTEEFVRVLYNLESTLVVLDSRDAVVLVNKTHVGDLVPVVKDKKR